MWSLSRYRYQMYQFQEPPSATSPCRRRGLLSTLSDISHCKSLSLLPDIFWSVKYLTGRFCVASGWLVSWVWKQKQTNQQRTVLPIAKSREKSAWWWHKNIYPWVWTSLKPFFCLILKAIIHAVLVCILFTVALLPYISKCSQASHNE